MGHAVESVAGERGHEVMARLTTADNIDGAALTPERLADVDVVIDFTRPDAAPRNIERAAGCGVDVVVGTTRAALRGSTCQGRWIGVSSSSFMYPSYSWSVSVAAFAP